jgi:hypothetical protein
MATRGKPQTKEAKLLDMLYGKPAAGDLRNTPMLKRTGEGSYLRQQYPEVYGGGAGLLGIAPDELGGSVLDPNTARVRKAADVTFPIGTAAQVAPLAGPALKGAKMTGKALGSGLNEAIYHGAQSPLSKFIPEAVKPLNVVKPKGGGGNWFNVDKELDRLKPNAGIDPKDAYELGLNNRGDVAIHNWIDTKLNKYVRNEMGTPNDPVRALTEKGKLHFEPDVGTNLRTRAQLNRQHQGYPTEGSAESQLAADWEALTDSQIQGRQVKNIHDGDSLSSDVLQNLSPEDTVYSFGSSFRPTKMLGFDHIIDELRNATALGDNLPKVLQIDPAKLDKMSVSDVVNHVSKINEWRANQAARAHDEMIKVLEKSPVTEVMKEYPDGYKWVELKIPEVSPERMAEGDPKAIAAFLEQKKYLGMTDAEAKRELNLWAAPSEWKSDLEKALKLEGDSMGHCVGGYCPDVIAGRARIFSLRDPKGRAHATIEAMPDPLSAYDRWMDVATQAEKDAFGNFLSKNGMGEGGLNQAYKDFAASLGTPINDAQAYSIVQIKGKGNARPIEKYDPYTQDFVINNDWHIVDEIQNTGLRDTRYELAPTLQYAEDLGLKLPKYMSDKDYRQLIQHMDETLETGIPREVPEVLKKYAPVEAPPASAPVPTPAAAPEPITNPFWYNPKSKHLEAFDLENTHTKSLMDPDYATKLGVAPLDPSSLNLEHGSLLMGRTEKTAPNTLNLMQVDEFTPESLTSIQAMLNEKNLPHEKFSLSGGSSLYENVPAEAIRGAKTLEDLKKFRIGGEEPPAYAAGGAVSTPDDFTTPDMSDSSKFFTDPDFARFVMEQSR